MEFGFWILDFGFWSLDFGFWILEFGFWILDFGFWSLDFGFWILDFGLDEALPDIVWILHKIFPCHADSGRRTNSCISGSSRNINPNGLKIAGALSRVVEQHCISEESCWAIGVFSHVQMPFPIATPLLRCPSLQWMVATWLWR